MNTNYLPPSADLSIIELEDCEILSDSSGQLKSGRYDHYMDVCYIIPSEGVSRNETMSAALWEWE